MNKQLAFLTVTGLALLTVAGCATPPNGNATKNQPLTSSTTNTSDAHVASHSTKASKNIASNTGNNASSVQISLSDATSSHANYANEIALIKNKGYSVSGTTPNATVKTSSGATLSAWIGITGGDGYNQFVFFFLNGKYLGTDTAKPSVAITSAKAAGDSIAVTYPVYKNNDSFANPTGAPVTITYTWNGSKLVPNKPYPKQFQSDTTTNQDRNPISKKSYSTTAEAANQIASLQAAKTAFSGGPPTLNLGHGITAKTDAGMGHAGYQWHEGNWTIEILFYTENSGVKQVAENMVSYLHTHMLPAPNKHGAIVVKSEDTNTTFKPKTTIAWQEGSTVYELQQTGNPIQALETVVDHQS
ncbi:LppP/LprE family lipoprotein [Alicyclobacillus fodiniaquatilis]|uniref:LppP/LprE family lipoprotein n=1 Tax=Alicyclobacillus fodiniaquatilis TaxID=1661150 RepID=A0ABW4JK57_9BACL